MQHNVLSGIIISVLTYPLTYWPA